VVNFHSFTSEAPTHRLVGRSLNGVRDLFVLGGVPPAGGRGLLVNVTRKIQTWVVARPLREFVRARPTSAFPHPLAAGELRPTA
jgi:hypothetical protein